MKRKRSTSIGSDMDDTTRIKKLLKMDTAPLGTAEDDWGQLWVPREWKRWGRFENMVGKGTREWGPFIADPSFVPTGDSQLIGKELNRDERTYRVFTTMIPPQKVGKGCLRVSKTAVLVRSWLFHPECDKNFHLFTKQNAEIIRDYWQNYPMSNYGQDKATIPKICVIPAENKLDPVLRDNMALHKSAELAKWMDNSSRRNNNSTATFFMAARRQLPWELVNLLEDFIIDGIQAVRTAPNQPETDKAILAYKKVVTPNVCIDSISQVPSLARQNFRINASIRHHAQNIKNRCARW
jgi:hypothetical protein